MTITRDNIFSVGASTLFKKADSFGSRHVRVGRKDYYAVDTVTDFHSWEDTRWDSYYPLHLALKYHHGFFEAD